MTCKVEGKWWLVHEWSKWTEGQATYPHGVTRQVQIRECQRCGRRDAREQKVKK